MTPSCLHPKKTRTGVRNDYKYIQQLSEKMRVSDSDVVLYESIVDCADWNNGRNVWCIKGNRDWIMKCLDMNEYR